MEGNFNSYTDYQDTKDIIAVESRSKPVFSFDQLKKAVDWARNNRNLRNISLTLTLSILLAVNQFLLNIRFFIFVNDVFFQLFLPAILSILVIYWADELEDIVKISFSSLFLFALFYSIIRLLPWLLGYIPTGGTITLFFNFTTIIQILPAICVMVLLGATIAAIIQEIFP